MTCIRRALQTTGKPFPPIYGPTFPQVVPSPGCPSCRWSAIVTTHVSDGIEFDVERGPNWLIVRLHFIDASADVSHLADELWSVAARHFIYRLVLELDELDAPPSELMGQLAMLQERLAQCDGALRICGLSPECVEMLQSCQLESALPNHATLEEAVLGSTTMTLSAH